MSQITYSFVKSDRLFSPQFYKSYMSMYGYLEVFQTPVDFEIKRVNCTQNILNNACKYIEKSIN